MKLIVGQQESTILPNQSIDYPIFPDWAIESIGFIQSYLNGIETLDIKTSGSTGIPKSVLLSRAQLTESAFKTNAYFHLDSSDVFYCCINTGYIGGKMMLIRAAELEATLILVEPSSSPFQGKPLKSPTFMALVPLQLAALVEEWETLAPYFGKLKAIIIGGGAIPKVLEAKVKDFPIPIFHTYGMTETVSHIALRRVNGFDRSGYFTALPMVEVKTNAEGALRVRADVTNWEWLQTNDLVEVLSPTTFRFKGRKDFVINSGGIKIHLDTLEQELETHLSELKVNTAYFLAGMPDVQLGEKLVLVIENFPAKDVDGLKTFLKARLPKYHDIKEVFSIDNIVRTPNGKIDRATSLAKLLN